LLNPVASYDNQNREKYFISDEDRMDEIKNFVFPKNGVFNMKN
jgi:hypothetical protein